MQVTIDDCKNKPNKFRNRCADAKDELMLIGNFAEAEKYAKRGRSGGDVWGGVVKMSRESRLVEAAVAATARPPPSDGPTVRPAPRTSQPRKVLLRYPAKLPRGDWTGFNSAPTAPPQLRTRHQVRAVSTAERGI